MPWLTASRNLTPLGLLAAFMDVPPKSDEDTSKSDNSAESSPTKRPSRSRLTRGAKKPAKLTKAAAAKAEARHEELALEPVAFKPTPKPSPAPVVEQAPTPPPPAPEPAAPAPQSAEHDQAPAQQGGGQGHPDDGGGQGGGG